MIYSMACAYAIRALTRLAMIRPDGNVLLDELCKGSDLPRHFVAKIFQDLARQGLLTSRKGRGGGFALARKPSEITLLDIVTAVDGTEHLENCALGLAHCSDDQPCPHHEEWKPVREHVVKFLTQTTVEQMAKSLAAKTQGQGGSKSKSKKRAKGAKSRA